MQVSRNFFLELLTINYFVQRNFLNFTLKIMSDPIYQGLAKDTRKRGVKFELIKLSSSSWSLFIDIKAGVLKKKKRKVHFSLKLSKKQWIKPMKCNASFHPFFFPHFFFFPLFYMLYVESFTRIDDFNASLWHAQLQMFIFRHETDRVRTDTTSCNRWTMRAFHGSSCMNKIATTALFAWNP